MTLNREKMLLRASAFLEQVHFFDRTRLGRIGRAVFWKATVFHLVFFFLLFAVFFETAYRLEMQPDSAFVVFWMNFFSITFLVSLLPAFRMASRRLHDAGLSAAWLWLVFIPVAGFFIIGILLLLPSDPCPNRWDDFADPDSRAR